MKPSPPQSTRRPTASAPDEAPQRLRFAAEIPGGALGPLWKISVEALSEPAAGGGDTLRLRAHVQTNLASVIKPALAAMAAPGMARLPAPAAAALGALSPIAQQAGQWLSQRIQHRVQQSAPRLARWAAPLLQHDFNTWFELHASTAPLVQGAQALLPQADKLGQLGITPNTGPNAPAVQTWQGRIGDEAAQVSLLRLDDRQLPDSLRAQLGGMPFQIAAAMVNVVARKD